MMHNSSQRRCNEIASPFYFQKYIFRNAATGIVIRPKGGISSAQRAAYHPFENECFSFENRYIITARPCISSMQSRTYHGGSKFSLRLGHISALTVHRTVIHSRNAALLPALQKITARPWISSMRSIVYHPSKGWYIITAKPCISSARRVAYHQCEALYIIHPKGWYIITAKPCISSARRVAYHQCEALYIIHPQGWYIITARPWISSAAGGISGGISSRQSRGYHQCEALYIIHPKDGISSRQGRVYHQCEALYIIHPQGWHIITAKPWISSMRSIVSHPSERMAYQKAPVLRCKTGGFFSGCLFLCI